MPLSSMTGFARVNGQTPDASWIWELRSVNAKGLDIRLKLPARAEALEGEARRMLGAVVARGTVHASLDLTLRTGVGEVRINGSLASRLLAQLRGIARETGSPEPGVEAVLGMRGVVEAADESGQLDEQLVEALRTSLADAIVALVSARRGEGEALSSILIERLKAMGQKVDAAESLPARSAEAVKARLKRQIDDLLEASGGTFDPQRLHQEAVMLAVKADIREEIDRLKAHVDQGLDLVAKGGPVGRRLDFLAQELSREINTLCAKSNDVGLTEIGLDAKGLVEQFREQVQNVE
jgi:uncharacterized protein (TIGR00255 family)